MTTIKQYQIFQMGAQPMLRVIALLISFLGPFNLFASYESIKEDLSSHLKTFDFQEDSYLSFLKTAHTKNPEWPEKIQQTEEETKKDQIANFLKGVLTFVAFKTNCFFDDYFQARPVDPEDARFLVGAVNLTLMETFHSFSQDEPEKRKKVMSFISESLQKISALSRIDDKLKREISLNEAIFGIHHLDEMIGYRNYPHVDQKKKEWMTVYWNKLASHPSRSQYLNILASLLLMKGHPKEVEDPLHPLFEPLATSFERGEKTKESPEISTITQRTNHAKKLYKTLKAHFSNHHSQLPQTVPTLPDSELPVTCGSALSSLGSPEDDSSDIKFEAPFESYLGKRRHEDLDGVLDTENEDECDKEPKEAEKYEMNSDAVINAIKEEECDRSSHSPPRKRQRREALGWDARLTYETVKDIFLSAWDNGKSLKNADVLRKMKLDKSKENTKRVTQLRHLIKKAYPTRSPKKITAYEHMANFYLDTPKIKKQSLKKDYECFNKKHPGLVSLRYFKDTAGIVLRILQYDNLVATPPKLGKENDKFTAIYDYLTNETSLDNLSYQDYQRGAPQNHYNKKSFDEIVVIYTHIQKIKDSRSAP